MDTYPIVISGQDLTDDQLLEVAETLGKEWKQAAFHLGLKPKELDDIKAEHKSLIYKKHKMLVLWKRKRRTGEATAQELLRCLKDIPDETRLLLTGPANTRPCQHVHLP
ncbi:unnamed protein product [Arctogadus glacialis]